MRGPFYLFQSKDMVKEMLAACELRLPVLESGLYHFLAVPGKSPYTSAPLFAHL